MPRQGIIDSVINELKRRTRLHTVPTLRAGHLTGSLFPSGNGLAVPIWVRPTTQSILDADLELLLDILERIKKGLLILIITEPGSIRPQASEDKTRFGTHPESLPQTFKDECARLGIRIYILNDYQDIPKVLEKVPPPHYDEIENN